VSEQVWVCMHVCVYLCTHDVCTYARTHVHTHAHSRTQTHECYERGVMVYDDLIRRHFRTLARTRMHTLVCLCTHTNTHAVAKKGESSAR